MLDLAPFVATRYADGARLHAVTAVATDLGESAAVPDEHGVARLTRPGEAAGLLARWRTSGVLTVDDEPALHLYEIVDGDVLIRGWVGAVALDPAAILRHEDTVAAAVAERLALLAATEAEVEPIVLAHEGAADVADEVAAQVVAERPVAELVDGAGARHRLWRVAGPDAVQAVRADLAGRRAVIADGHHRWASCLAYRATRPGPGPWDRGLALVVPSGARGPRVRAIHRVVPGRVLLDAPGWHAEPLAPPVDADRLLAGAGEATVLLTDGTRWVRLTAPDRDVLPAGAPVAWRGLDVALVDAGLVGRAWGATGDVLLRSSTAAAVATAVATGGTAVLLRPVAPATVLEVAAQGVLMPRKSTLFVPKPRAGLVMRCYVDQKEPG